MKKIFAFICFIACVSYSYAQSYELNIDAKVVKNFNLLKKGTDVRLLSMTHNLVFDNDEVPVHSYTLDTNVGSVVIKDKLEKVLDVDYKDAQMYWSSQIIFNVLESLSKNGTQEELRAEMEDYALDYLNFLESHNAKFDDPYLEAYLYSVVSKLAPSVLIDGRPGNVNLFIESNQTPNASTFSNGTIIITTGLLSLLHSEDELAAVLAHEIAHFILDHSVQNYNKQKQREKRAEFWAAFATVLTGIAEGVAAANDPYYIPGGATLAVAAASTQIASELCRKLGMIYNRKQEQEADDVAAELLKVMNYDPNALATALSRIEETLKQERSIEMYFASDHPALVDRIQKAGTPSDKVDQNFERIISFAVSDAANMKLQDRRFRQALNFFSQNIDNNVATADDYIQKAYCLLFLRSDPGIYSEISSLLNQAKSISSSNINIYKVEILTNLRQNKYREASSLLSEYKNKLSEMMVIDNNLPESFWQNAYSFARNEYRWAEDMYAKLRAFR